MTLFVHRSIDLEIDHRPIPPNPRTSTSVVQRVLVLYYRTSSSRFRFGPPGWQHGWYSPSTNVVGHGQPLHFSLQRNSTLFKASTSTVLLAAVFTMWKEVLPGWVLIVAAAVAIFLKEKVPWIHSILAILVQCTPRA